MNLAKRCLVILATLFLLGGVAHAADNFILGPDLVKKIDFKDLTSAVGTVLRQSVVICAETTDDCVPTSNVHGIATTMRDSSGNILGSSTNPVVTTGKLSVNTGPSTERGAVLPCVSTAGDPSYTENKDNPCSTDLAGYSRVVVKENGLTSPTVIVSAASTNATNIKASAGILYSFTCTNNHASSHRYIALHNNAGTPTAGSGVFKKYMIPFGGGVSPNLGGDGIAFSTGIAMTLVTGAAASDATAVGANEILCNFEYR